MITLLDGGFGSYVWDLAEKNGFHKDPPWKFSIEHPEIVTEVHKRYIAAGSDIIQTNTFSANAQTIKRDGKYSVEEVVTAAVRLARKAVEGTAVKVYLSSGPLMQLLEPYGDLSEEDCADIYREIFEAGCAEGVDGIIIETFMDIEMMKIAATEAKKFSVPVLCSMTFEKRHRTMMGNTIETICRELEAIGVDAVGMNCSKGPKEAFEIIKEFHDTTSLPLFFKPNSGIGETYSAKQFADEVKPALEFVSYVGGCCGSNDEYIKQLRGLIKKD